MVHSVDAFAEIHAQVEARRRLPPTRNKNGDAEDRDRHESLSTHGGEYRRLCLNGQASVGTAARPETR